MPKPTAAAPVSAFALFENAAPVVAFDAGEAVAEVAPEAAGEVALGVAVRVTPTLLQIACEYASAFAKSAPEQALVIQMVVLLMKD